MNGGGKLRNAPSLNRPWHRLEKVIQSRNLRVLKFSEIRLSSINRNHSNIDIVAMIFAVLK